MSLCMSGNCNEKYSALNHARTQGEPFCYTRYIIYIILSLALGVCSKVKVFLFDL